MQGLASFVMRGRWQAALVIAGMALLPVLNLFSGAALVLVTLRQGLREGLLTGLLGVAASAILLLLLTGSVIPAAGLAGTFWLPLWLLAVILRYTVALDKTLPAALLGVTVAMLAYAAYLGDPTAWGAALLEQVLEPVLAPLGVAGDAAALAQVRELLAPLILGLIFANILFTILISLLLGRWWQALLYYPGGFRREFHELRLGRPMALMALGVFSLAVLLNQPLLVNLAMLWLVVYALQGVALVHGLVARAGLALGWLIGFYVLLALALPQLAVILCLLSVLDPWADFRARVKPRAGGR